MTKTDGTVTATITYDSFGKIQGTFTGDRFKFAGMQYDSEISLYYAQARYYDPNVGRFLNEDPLGFGGGDTNLFRYVNNNPTSSVDPLGLYGEGGFWDSLGNSIYSIGLTYKGIYQYATGNFPAAYNTFDEAYERGPLGQTQNSSGVYYYGTRGALGVATVSVGAAVVCNAVGFNPWLGTWGLHGPHHGLGTHFEVIIRGLSGNNFKLIFPGKDSWIWWGYR
jgi:RHS repeat-associated protein